MSSLVRRLLARDGARPNIAVLVRIDDAARAPFGVRFAMGGP